MGYLRKEWGEGKWNMVIRLKLRNEIRERRYSEGRKKRTCIDGVG